MQFLYPKSRQFPFDEVCEQIVRALHARNFQVPGFTVVFRDYGSGAQKLRYVSEVKSSQLAIDLGHHDVVIRFGRPQGLLPGEKFNDVAAVDSVQLAKRALHVYPDESGPTYDVYVGSDWEHDRSTWWSRLNARLDKEPRLCVRYSGRNSYRNTRAAILEFVEDRREYGPQDGEQWTFRTSEVMEEFRVYLQGVVLPGIEAHPIAATVDDVCVEPSPIPFPNDRGPFFTYGEPRDVRRIELGKKCLDELPLAERYGLASNLRLAHLSIKSGADLPEVAFDGFIWCGTIGAGWRVPGYMRRSFEDYLVKVTPKDARGVYVANDAVYEKLRAELGAQIKDQRDCFTQAEVDSFIRARACTIVPITEYKGNYEDPVYLINRELGFDEVEVIGPWRS
jgi:hypothetical protein